MHYLLECPLYANERMQLFINITLYTERHLGTLYCKEFVLRLLLLSTKYSFRQLFKYSGAILLLIL
jgi:hypothetical protein